MEPPKVILQDVDVEGYLFGEVVDHILIAFVVLVFALMLFILGMAIGEVILN